MADRAQRQRRAPPPIAPLLRPGSIEAGVAILRDALDVDATAGIADRVTAALSAASVYLDDLGTEAARTLDGDGHAAERLRYLHEDMGLRSAALLLCCNA